MKRLPDINLLREVLTYDPESGELRWKVAHPSSKVSAGDIAGHLNKKGYTYVKVRGQNYAAHRICWALHYGEDPYPHLVDHKKGKEKGNGISNLRLATGSENSLNRKLQYNNKSGHRGVSYAKERDEWVARLKVGGRLLILGNYKCKEEAIAARLQAEADNNIYVRE
jgi:hypothetical protein